MVPYGVHMMHTCTMEIKSMMSEHMYVKIVDGGLCFYFLFSLYFIFRTNSG